MKSAFISGLAAFAGIAAAEAVCKVDGDYKNVESRDICNDAIKNIVDKPDDKFTAHYCYTASVSADGCAIQVCTTDKTPKDFTNKEIASDIDEIMNTCAPDANTPFQGQITSGGPDKEHTVIIALPVGG